jgi:hypothetical protein
MIATMLRRTGVRLRMGSAVDVRTLLFVSGLDMVGFLTVWYCLYLFVFLVRLKIPLDLLTRRIFQTSIVINTALCKRAHSTRACRLYGPQRFAYYKEKSAVSNLADKLVRPMLLNLNVGVKALVYAETGSRCK